MPCRCGAAAGPGMPCRCRGDGHGGDGGDTVTATATSVPDPGRTFESSARAWWAAVQTVRTVPDRGRIAIGIWPGRRVGISSSSRADLGPIDALGRTCSRPSRARACRRQLGAAAHGACDDPAYRGVESALGHPHGGRCEHPPQRSHLVGNGRAASRCCHRAEPGRNLGATLEEGVCLTTTAPRRPSERGPGLGRGRAVSASPAGRRSLAYGGERWFKVLGIFEPGRWRRTSIARR